jgi:hypothetical protein
LGASVFGAGNVRALQHGYVTLPNINGVTNVGHTYAIFVTRQL